MTERRTLAAGAPFISQKDAAATLAEAGVPEDDADEILAQNEALQVHGLCPLSRCWPSSVLALFFT
jgi:hypothetical protein